MAQRSGEDHAVRGQALHGAEAGGLRGLRQLPGPGLHEPRELHPRAERRLGLLRPPRLPRAAVRPGARRLPRLPPLERPQRPHGLLSARGHGPQHGEHFRLEIFEGCNFTGQCLEFQEDCPLLQSRGWAKSCVNAIKVYGDGAWVLYEEPNYRGRMYLVQRGDFRSFSDWEAPSGRIQSLRRVVNFF